MIPEVTPIEAGSPAAKLNDDELLVILGPPGREHPSWVKDLMAKAVKSLGRSHHYLSYHVGFLRDAGAAPYVVVDWQKPGTSVL